MTHHTALVTHYPVNGSPVRVVRVDSGPAVRDPGRGAHGAPAASVLA